MTAAISTKSFNLERRKETFHDGKQNEKEEEGVKEEKHGKFILRHTLSKPINCAH
jgi:hypothetical protein